MKAALFAMSLLAGSTHAQTIDCPAKLQAARLIGAGVYEGAEKQYELAGGRKKVRGGWDADFGFNGGEVKWLACWYEPDVPRWYQLNAEAKRCDLQQRGAAPGTVTVKMVCR